MDMQSLLMIAGAAGVAFVGAKTVIGVDNRAEDRRRHAISLAAWAKSNGLPIVGSIFESYAVHDLSSLVGSLKQAKEILEDPVMGQTVLKNFLNIQLDKQLSTAEGKEELLSAVEKKLNLKIDRAALSQIVTVVKGTG